MIEVTPMTASFGDLYSGDNGGRTSRRPYNVVTGGLYIKYSPWPGWTVVIRFNFHSLTWEINILMWVPLSDLISGPHRAIRRSLTGADDS